MNKEEETRKVDELTKLLQDEKISEQSKFSGKFLSEQSIQFAIFISGAYRFDKETGIEFLSTGISSIITMMCLDNTDEGLHILKEIAQQTRQNLIEIDKVFRKPGEK